MRSVVGDENSKAKYPGQRTTRMHIAEEEDILSSDLATSSSGVVIIGSGICADSQDQKSQVVFIYLCDLSVPHSKVGEIRFLKVGSGD